MIVSTAPINLSQNLLFILDRNEKSIWQGEYSLEVFFFLFLVLLETSHEILKHFKNE